MRRITAMFLGLITVLVSAAAPSAQAPLPPVSYVCPMSEHSQVLEDKAGACPICAMALVPVRIVQAYACPTHAAVLTEGVGLCPIDKRALMPVVVALFWTCSDRPNEHLTEPGRCSNGAPRQAVREQRAHGDHNPKHGGQFFMATDKWHHVEATYPRAGLVRLYVYDNFTQSLSARGLRARAVTLERYNPTTRTTVESETAPLTPARGNSFLEGRVNLTTLPAKFTVRMRFDPRLPEDRFDFVFEAYSREPAVSLTSSAAPSVRPSAQTPTRTAPVSTTPPAEVLAPRAADDRTSSAMPAVPATPAMPATPAALLDLLTAQVTELGQLVARGQLGEVYIPALRSKDLALALDEHSALLSERGRVEAASALKRVVVSAWQLDAFGDRGDRVRVESAYRDLVSAVTSLKAVHASGR